MQQLVYIIYKIIEQTKLRLSQKYYALIVRTKLYLNNVQFGSVSALGIPILKISKSGLFTIGNNLNIRSGGKYTDTGGNRPCKFIVSKGAKLIIGNGVGISSSTIVCRNSITIGNNVLIGGGCHIVDTDFHPIESKSRVDPKTANSGKTAPIVIEDNAFIGMNSIILKGVYIGKNSIIASGSVVVKNIPENEIWGGNPAKFLKKL